ncbi:MAG: CapA family protein [Butyricicoccus sp.]
MRRNRFLALLLALGMVLGGCTSRQSGAASSAEEGWRPAESVAEPEPEPAPEPVVATLAVCGDTMSHMPQTRDAWDDVQGKYDYSVMLSGARKWVEQADFAVANLETTFAGGPDYSGYPAFNSPDDLADNLKDMGVDLLLTANNHCMDRGFDGLSRTLDVLDERGLQHVGTYRTQEERGAASGAVVADVGGISVAFLGYTYGTNGIPVASDRKFSVNIFNTDYMANCTEPDTATIEADLAAARALGTDLIAVMIHWGVEYQTTQNAYQEEIASLLFANGADIILGGHSHVPQPMELRTVTDENGQEKQGFVCFSLGNFISAQNDRYTDTTAVLNLTLTKDMETGETTVSGYSYAPMLMLDRESGADVRYQLLDAQATLDEGGISDALAAKLQQCIDDCHTIFDAAA